VVQVELQDRLGKLATRELLAILEHLEVPVSLGIQDQVDPQVKPERVVELVAAVRAVLLGRLD
jgi:hypothetical protein